MEENLHLRAERLNNVTATEMSIILGLNPYETPRSLLDKKNNPKPIISNHLRRGKLKEPSVLEAFFLDMHMKTYRHYGGTLTLDGHRIAATPDAYVLNTNNVVECKSVTTRNITRWYKQIPDYYHIQVLVQMLVTGAEEGYIGALEEGDPYECEYRFVAWKILPNDEIFSIMKTETERFWRETQEGKLFRVSSKVKKRVKELLAAELVYCTEQVEEETKDEDKLSYILSLFQ